MRCEPVPSRFGFCRPLFWADPGVFGAGGEAGGTGSGGYRWWRGWLRSGWWVWAGGGSGRSGRPVGGGGRLVLVGDQAADLHAVAGKDAIPAPDLGSGGAVHEASTPAVAAFERGNATL